MDDNSGLYIEERIAGAVKSLLAGRVNEALGEAEYFVPPVEFGNYRGGSVVVPAICLSACERSEKERIIRVDAYSLTIAFRLPEGPEAERNAYTYAAAVAAALRENPTLGGVVDRAELTGKQYVPPKQTGGDFAVILTLRISREETGA
jgi:hypothetical protein